MDLTGTTDNKIFGYFNKNTQKYPSISFSLSPYENELTIFGNKKETIITTNSQYDLRITGELCNVIRTNKEFQKNRDLLLNLYEDATYHFDNGNNKELAEVIDMIKNAEVSVFVNFTKIFNLEEVMRSNNDLKEFYNAYNKCTTYLLDILNLFPRFILIKDMSLKSEYALEELRDGNVNKEMLILLLKAIGYKMNQLLEYWNLQSTDDQENFKSDINYNLQLLMARFNKFYTQDKVILKLTFQKDGMGILVKTSKKYLNFNERSNGLKWYLNMFIQFIVKLPSKNGNSFTNNVFLIDEPGIYLHINAQKELRDLFENLSAHSNQIIYTTHSRFLIDVNKMHRIRLVIKDEEGNSHISNKLFTSTWDEFNC